MKVAVVDQDHERLIVTLKRLGGGRVRSGAQHMDVSGPAAIRHPVISRVRKVPRPEMLAEQIFSAVAKRRFRVC